MARLFYKDGLGDGHCDELEPPVAHLDLDAHGEGELDSTDIGGFVSNFRNRTFLVNDDGGSGRRATRSKHPRSNSLSRYRR